MQENIGPFNNYYIWTKHPFNKYMEGWSMFLIPDLTIQQLAETIPKAVLNASDKDLDSFQKIIEETIKLREGHRNLQKMVKSFSSSVIQRS